MSASKANVTFTELLEANERETRKWQGWFERQPALLDLPLDIAEAKNVRELLLHIFAVEMRYAERLLGLPVTPWDWYAAASQVEPFAIGEKARGLLREYVANATDAELASTQEFPTRTAGVLHASQRKMFIHAMLHGLRHWSQLATALREKRHGTDWPHDFLFSEVME